MLRDQLMNELKTAMKAGDKVRLSTIRLIQAALKDKDIEARGAGKGPLPDEEILQLLQKMVKQRQESARLYAEGGRAELAAQENDEIAVIAGFMPQQMDEAEARAAIQAVIAEIGAAGIKDMGKVMGELKARFAGRMDFGKASPAVKQLLGG
ncbi:GatB/YqeY domain-containing protein [Phreatobacter sp. AB_2022a]|uniref:GatB/YqeY domain-containing protein n=1 Tax=Phreatobacter sp. AB_2022a TaxID=3003134 RepID=UPI0022874EA0|nr:GatB/YqeY domain-containing protein [Phreatobacter sp. AB_2022a]MCZ0735128.1 GatB/YqeY domain-containing protein [Phreatobacter sp. AB_2022a]